jgi:hypothetical protein
MMMKLTTLCFLILVFIGYANVFAFSGCLKLGCNGESAISEKFVCEGFTCEQGVCNGTCTIKDSKKIFQGNFNLVCKKGVCSIDPTNKLGIKKLKSSYLAGNQLKTKFTPSTGHQQKNQYVNVNVFFLIDATASMQFEPSPFKIATKIAEEIAKKLNGKLKNKFNKPFRFGFMIYRDKFAEKYPNLENCDPHGICLYYPFNKLGDFKTKVDGEIKKENDRNNSESKRPEEYGDGYEEQLFLAFEKTLEEMGKKAYKNDLNLVIVIGDNGDKKGILSSKMCSLTQKMTNLFPFFIQTPKNTQNLNIENLKGKRRELNKNLYVRAYKRYENHAKTLIKLILRNKFNPKEINVDDYFLSYQNDETTIELVKQIATTVINSYDYDKKNITEAFFKKHQLTKGWVSSNYNEKGGLLKTSIRWKKFCLSRTRVKIKRKYSHNPITRTRVKIKRKYSHNPITGIGVALHPNIKSVRTQTWKEILEKKSTTEMEPNIVSISVIPYIVQSQEKFMLIPNTPEFNAFMPACSPGFAGLGKESQEKPYQYPTVRLIVENKKIRDDLVDFLKNQLQKDSCCCFDEFTEAPVNVAKTDPVNVAKTDPVTLLYIFQKIFDQKKAVFLNPFSSTVTIKLWESEKINKDSEKTNKDKKKYRILPFKYHSKRY